MQVQFIVTVNICKQVPQDTKEFLREDAKALVPYLTGKIRESLSNSWQYNAEVRKVSVSRAIHKPKSNRLTAKK